VPHCACAFFVKISSGTKIKSGEIQLADLWYAVTMREGPDALLYRRIRRNGKGEVFVFFPPAVNWPDAEQAKAKEAGWAHATYHDDGTVQLWDLFGDKPLPPRKQQPLDKSFHGTSRSLVRP
jgi:hypothetical protein